MGFVVALFGLFVALLGMTGLLSPQPLLALVTRAQSRTGLYFIAGFRLLIGGALLLAAPGARAPSYLQALGALSLVSGVITPFLGVERFEAILDWWRVRPPWAVRLWSALVLLFGASLIWAVAPATLAT